MKTTNHSSRILAAVLGVWLLPLMTLGQGQPDLPYDSGSTGTDGALTFRSFLSPGRRDHGMAYDDTRHETVVFGGYSSRSGGYLGDTWTWFGSEWKLKTPAQSPSAREDAALAYDAERKVTVLFGGDSNTGYFSDTWTWNGTAWTQLNPVNSPPRRTRHSMVYDSVRKKVVLFGGYSPEKGYLNDTWLWDGTTWTQVTPATSPGARDRHAMAFDAARQVVVLFSGEATSDTATWTWDGTNWTSASPNSRPPRLQDYAMAFDGTRGQTLLFGGYNLERGSYDTNTWAWDGIAWTSLALNAAPAARANSAMVFDTVRNQVVLVGGAENIAESWVLNATQWDLWSADYAYFDMTPKADGVWNYTTIDVPAGITVYFQHNAANTPVRWLASGNVTINGILNLNGDDGSNNPNPGNEAKGGPGGYAGGLGAIRFDQSSTYAGTPGQGPGGGSPGVGAQDGSNGGQRYAQQGTYNGTYGNAYLQPLLGGSGGGGGGSGFSDSGGNGGGGGGAILISSARDIVINGGIFANGGRGSSYAGFGSGGGIRLVADRISGGGSLQANGGGAGRIRLEAYYRSLAGNTTPVSSVSAPIATRNFDHTSALTVSKVAGAVIAQPPTGSSISPDVIFTAAGSITVEVTGKGIPDNTPVTLRVTTATGVINKPAQNEPVVPLVGGKASFTVTVPAGLGTIQAFAQFTQQ